MTRVALIGFGYAGRVFHAPLIAATPGLTLTVIGSRQRDHAGSAYPGVEVVSDPLVAVRHGEVDLVVIATPNDTHASLAEAALGAGKHVVVDKPFTVTLAEARALVATAAAAKRLLSVFQNRRWDSDFLGIARELGTGRLGEVIELRSEISRYRPRVRDRWRERAGPGAGLWYDLGPHLIDQAGSVRSTRNCLCRPRGPARRHGRRLVPGNSRLWPEASDPGVQHDRRGPRGSLSGARNQRKPHQAEGRPAGGSTGIRPEARIAGMGPRPGSADLLCR